MVNPILKWAGGKRSLIPNIIRIFPFDYQDRVYHEPFFGGGAVFFKIRPKSGSINDINPRLMNFYRFIRDNPEELILMAKKYNYNEETYYQLRDHFNQKKLSKIEEAAVILYLNKTAFNGLYRVNSKGEFNVPFGYYKNPKIVPIKRIRIASKILKRVEIFNEDFSYILEHAQKGDLCYFDPPYHPINRTSNFTSYSPKGFELIEQKKLRDLCVSLNEKGVFFVLSNSSVDQIIELYKNIIDFHIQIVQAKRVISSKVSTRGPINEILVTNIKSDLSNKNTVKRYLNDQ